MIEYTQSLCLSDKTGKYGSYATACKALAENARYKLNDKTQAIKWYSEACKKGDTYSCEDAKY
jgi:TPR repeat protein